MRYLALIVVFSIFVTCDAQNKKKTDQKQLEASRKEQLIRMNQRLLSDESVKIDQYIASRHWEMRRTGSGLRIHIDQINADLPLWKNNQKATIAYSLADLNGKALVSVTPQSPFTFVPGHSELIQGLQEAVRYMKPGEKADLVIPSHLGYGKSGDGNTIPPSTVLVAHLELLKKD